MDERTKSLAGAALIVVSAVVILLFALPTSLLSVSVPVPLAAIAALGIAAGTLLVGTSEGAV
jgi:multidrug efflux pump subunit AcrB